LKTARPAKKRPEISVRAASKRDASAIANLSGQLGHPVATKKILKWFDTGGKNPNIAVFLAVSDTGQVAGFIDLFYEEPVYVEPRVDVAGLVVDEAFRGRGVGRLLMDHAEQWARQRKCRIVHLRSNFKRATAHAFYEAIGYTHFKTQKTFRKELK
jgi:GNAT superfamily N-acetyltransferase